MEQFQLLPNLAFFEERQQLAFIGNVPPCPYVRLCKQLRDGATLSPLFGITAVLGSSAIVDRFLQRYNEADENGKDEQASKVAFGMAAIILKYVRFDDDFQEWFLNLPDEETRFFDQHYSEHVVKRRHNLTTEQLAILGAKHIGKEQTYLDETRKQWEKHLPDHPKPLEIATSAAERYIEFVKDKTKSTEPLARLQESVEAEHQPVEAKQGNKSRKTCFRDKMLDDGDGRKLQILHLLIDGKGGNNARVVIDAAISIGWLTNTSGQNVEDEFAGICKSTFNHAVKTYKNQDCDIENVARTLVKLLNTPPEV